MTGASFDNKQEGLEGISFTHVDTSRQLLTDVSHIQLSEVLITSFIGITVGRHKEGLDQKETHEITTCGIIKNRNLNTSGVDIDTSAKSETLVQSNPLTKQILKEGDVLITTRFIDFWVAKVPALDSDIVAAQNIMVLRVDRDKILPEYLVAWLRSERGLLSIKENSTPVTSKRNEKHTFESFSWINVSQVRNLTIPVPTLPYQEEIVSSYGAVAAWKRNYSTELQRKEDQFNQAVNRLYE